MNTQKIWEKYEAAQECAAKMADTAQAAFWAARVLFLRQQLLAAGEVL